jgi:murein DD-endopeptidase MepM/ murein hydrolase activator NlpD
MARHGTKSAEWRICSQERRWKRTARRGAQALALTTTVVALVWTSWASATAAQAQTSTTTESTTPSSTTTTAANATTTTTKPKVTSTTVSRATTTTTTVVPTATTFPPALLAISNSVRRSGPSNDSALMAALVSLQKLGFTAQQAAIVGMGQFPVAGPAFYRDDWLEPRPGPVPRLHEGDDIVAAMGTPIRSPIDGTLRYDTGDPQGYGLLAVVTGPDKTQYYMAHMSATVKDLSTGSAVKMGQVVGFVGQTGDATGPHVHFEYHPFGGAGVDPKPVLDAWLAAAVKAVPELIRSIKAATESTAVTAQPVPVVLPAAQAAIFPPLGLPLSVPPGSGAPRSLAGLGLVALLALLATSGLAVVRYRPWRQGLRLRIAVDSP